jgi:NADPH:quinone reductase-like Zn-dependent oxidoreductase
VVGVSDVDRPVPEDSDVLVRVLMSSVNRTDCGFRSGKPFAVRLFTGLRGPRAGILGTEFAGVVEAMGSAVTSLAIGDRVFGFREWRFGAHAEYLTAPADGAIATIPDGVSDELAAASTEASHYALTNIRAARIRPGQDVLVYGATGAIGSAAVQFLHHMGVQVTAVCDTAHLDLARGLGADRVIDRTAEDFTKDHHFYDVVFDAVGKSTFGRCMRLLKPRGIFLSTDLGPYGQNPVLALTTPVGGGRRLKFPIPRPRDARAIAEIRGLLESGAFRPVIDRHYPLDEIVEAYRYVETGQKIGNLVIDITPAVSKP